MFRRLDLCGKILLSVSVASFGLVALRVCNSGTGSRAQGLQPKETTQWIGEVSAGQQIEVTVALENRSNEDVTVLGASRVCCAYCCVMPNGFPIRIPALAERVAHLTLDVGTRTGDFQISVTIYTDRSGSGDLAIQLRGRVRS